MEEYENIRRREEEENAKNKNREKKPTQVV
jgi:hypothetical protein